jgi:hypothetical protein
MLIKEVYSILQCLSEDDKVQYNHKQKRTLVADNHVGKIPT